MKISFLFPGQGSQYPGMGKDLYVKSGGVRELFSMAGDILSRNMRHLLFESTPEELKETQNTQIAVTLMNLSTACFLKERGISPDSAAGFSLGEYSALAECGILRQEEIFTLVLKRSEIMGEVVEKVLKPDYPGGFGMAAVLGLEPEKIDQLMEGNSDVYPANYNSPAQVVISGTLEGIERVSALLKKEGAKRIIPLKVSGPFHTPLLAEAAARFAEELASYPFKDPEKTFYSNVTGQAAGRGDEIMRLMPLQIVSPVRWTSVENQIISEGNKLCIEAGPGKVLTGLWSAASSEVPCAPAGTMEAIEEAARLTGRDSGKSRGY